MAEYFFFDEFGFLSINDKKVLDCYGEFTSVLIQVYNNIRNVYSKLCEKVMTDEELKDIDIPIEPRNIESKGLEYYLDKELK